jgi:hypothetical protein
MLDIGDEWGLVTVPFSGSDGPPAPVLDSLMADGGIGESRVLRAMLPYGFVIDPTLQRSAMSASDNTDAQGATFENQIWGP